MRFFFAFSSHGSNVITAAQCDSTVPTHNKVFLNGITTTQSSQENCEDDDDDDENYMIDEENENECVYNRELEKSSRQFKLKHLSLPLTETIAEFVQDLSNDKDKEDVEFFNMNDLSFIMDMSLHGHAISPYALIVALLYLKRLKSNNRDINSTTKANIINNYFSSTIEKTTDATSQLHKQQKHHHLTHAELCLISIILATKYLVDEGESDDIYMHEWAQCTDLSAKRLSSIEREFLARLNWNLFVSADEFWKFATHLSQRITRKKVKLQSNQCTYSDLDCLMSYSPSDMSTALQNLVKIVAICSSTLVYLAVSTYLVANGLIVIKHILTIANTIPTTTTSTNIITNTGTSSATPNLTSTYYHVSNEVAQSFTNKCQHQHHDRYYSSVIMLNSFKSNMYNNIIMSSFSLPKPVQLRKSYNSFNFTLSSTYFSFMEMQKQQKSSVWNEHSSFDRFISVY